MHGGSVSVIATETNKTVATIPVGGTPVQLAFDPDGKFVYVSLNGENAVAKIDVASRQVVGKATVGPGPVQVYVTPNGKYLLVANQGTAARPGRTLSVVDTASFAQVAAIVTGRGAHGVVVDPTSTRAYVTNVYSGDVAVVDLGARRVVAHVRVGAKPNGVSYSTLAPARPRGATLHLPLPSMSDMPGMDIGS
jgi:YVTN family beta-propeller protein